MYEEIVNIVTGSTNPNLLERLSELLRTSERPHAVVRAIVSDDVRRLIVFLEQDDREGFDPGVAYVVLSLVCVRHADDIASIAFDPIEFRRSVRDIESCFRRAVSLAFDLPMHELYDEWFESVFLSTLSYEMESTMTTIRGLFP